MERVAVRIPQPRDYECLVSVTPRRGLCGRYEAKQPATTGPGSSDPGYTSLPITDPSISVGTIGHCRRLLFLAEFLEAGSLRKGSQIGSILRTDGVIGTTV